MEWMMVVRCVEEHGLWKRSEGWGVGDGELWKCVMGWGGGGEEIVGFGVWGYFLFVCSGLE